MNGQPALTGSLQASTWAVLPVKNYAGELSGVKTGPALSEDSEYNSWEIARMLRLYLQAGKIYQVIPMAKVEHAYETFKFTGIRKLSAGELAQLATELDVDHLLLTTVDKEGNQYRIVSHVFYNHSQIIGDQISLKGNDFWQIVGQIAENRFPRFTPLPSVRTGSIRLIFGIDAQGKNFREIEQLGHYTMRLTMTSSSVVAMNGHGALEVSGTMRQKDDLAAYIGKIHAAGADLSDRIYITLLEKMIEQAEENPDPVANYSVLLVSSAPVSDDARKKTSQLFRRLRSFSHILVLGAGVMDTNEESFWNDLASEHNASRKILFERIHYRQKFGLSTGHSVFIYKIGRQLFESNGDLKSAHRMEISKEEADRLLPHMIRDIYEKSAYAKVISSGETEILFEEALLDFTDQSLHFAGSPEQDRSARILIEINKNPFWISIPKQALYNSNGETVLAIDKTHYFLLNMIPRTTGNVFNNQEDFALILPFEEVPRGLVLPVETYLRDPGRFLGHSLGGGSLYIVSGKVIMIRTQSKRY